MKVRIRRSGTIFIGVTLFMGIAAANTGNNLIYVIVSAMLSIMLTSGVASIINIRKLELKAVPPPEVYAGKKARIRIIIRRKIALPSFLLKVSCGKGEELVPLVWKTPVEVEVPVIFPKRGHVDKLVVRVSSDFPVGTFERTVWVEIPLNLVVFPSEIPSEIRLIGDQKENAGDRWIDLSERGYEEIKDIREYSGEPIKLIHWKLTAKKDQILVKEMSSLEDRPFVINLDELEGDLETRLSKATFLVNRLMKRGYPVGLDLNGKLIPPARGEQHRLNLLKELALY